MMRNMKLCSNLSNTARQLIVSRGTSKCNYHNYVGPQIIDINRSSGNKYHQMCLYFGNSENFLSPIESKSKFFYSSFSMDEQDIDDDDLIVPIIIEDKDSILRDAHRKTPIVSVRRERNLIRQKGLRIASHNARKGHKEDAEDVALVMKFVQIIPSELAERAMVSMRRAMLPNQPFSKVTDKDKFQAILYLCDKFLDMNTGLYYSISAKDFERIVFRPMLDILKSTSIKELQNDNYENLTSTILESIKQIVRMFLCRSVPFPQPLTKKQFKLYNKIYALKPSALSRIKYYDDIPQLYVLMSTATKICLHLGMPTDATDGFLYYYQHKYQMHSTFKNIKFLPEGCELELDRECDRHYCFDIDRWFRKKLAKDLAWKLT